MIEHLDTVLHRLFGSEVEGLSEDQVSFQPPDEDWRNHVNNINQRALNVYLVELRENRQLRSNERVRSVDDGVFTEEVAPMRIDCHYLVTAWSPATEAVGRTVDEHQLLHQVLAMLMNHYPLVPRDVFSPDPLPGGFPEILASARLPMAVAPTEGFPKLAEFWGSMGVNHRWKPAVYLIVTLPVPYETEVAGHMVTTRITEYRQMGRPDTAEEWIQIGGHLLDATVTPPVPVSGAWVQLENLVGEALETSETDEQGRFTFAELRAGQYRLRSRATGFVATSREIEIPSPTGEYDLQFT
jgi:5-hydroxyisourate hydrolase-like protein (transthyretin family)